MGERQRADQQCPLVDLGRDQCRDGCGALAARGKNRGDDELGCLRCQRREPLHQQELVDTQLRSGTHQTVGERLGAQQNDGGGQDEHRDDRAAAQMLGQHAYRCGGAHQIRFFGLAPADGEQIKAEPREQCDAEREMNLAACRDHKRHHPGDRQEPEFDAVGRLQRKQVDRVAGRLACHCQCEENDDRPSEAHQQTVRPGHVRRRVLGVLGDVTGDVGVVEIDGIFRQHRDQGQYCDREATGDIDLRCLCGPRQYEARGYYCRAVDHECEDWTGVQSTDPGDQRGRHEQRSGAY
ncbi:Uncharacterised protein [Mycobacteroides abscessus]|nr:Uncharacterised protein [Mycobacteroides abscessus]